MIDDVQFYKITYRESDFIIDGYVIHNGEIGIIKEVWMGVRYCRIVFINNNESLISQHLLTRIYYNGR